LRDRYRCFRGAVEGLPRWKMPRPYIARRRDER
jgi:hypothetical protein